MGTKVLDILAPLESPLPPPPPDTVLTESQWTTLLAIVDAIIPPIGVSSVPSPNKLSVASSEYDVACEKLRKNLPPGADDSLAQQYFQESPSSLPGFRDALHRILGQYVREDARKGIRVILSTLDTRAGCYLTTGYTTSFHLQPLNVRHQIIQNWRKSYLSPLRKTAKLLTSLTMSIWAKQSSCLGPVLGFPRTPIHGKPGKGFDYKFIQFPPGSESEVLETDVVIVGSGCGGGVCAKNIAESGNRVIVVEKAYYFPPEHLPMKSSEADIHLFMNGGMNAADNGSIAVVAGQAFGGGGTVNWSASLQTQAFVRKEWADGGLPFFTSLEFQTCLDRVCDRMGVSPDHIEHNPSNHALLEGARRLGYSAKPVPQNTGGNKHFCGYCTLGCGSAEKHGPVVSFLPDADRAGAKFIEGFDAEKILFDSRGGKKVVTGLKGQWTSRDSNGGIGGSDRITRDVTIKAKRVIVSAGSLQSPLLLLRSGLTNPQIGRNLHLHPVSILSATYPERINPWEGGILTVVVDEFQNLDAAGHGSKLEAMTMLPSWFLPFQQCNSGLDIKLRAAQLPFTAGYIALVRDRDTGRVFPDPIDGRCRIDYTPSAFDQKHALEGILALAKIAYVQGASEIFLSHEAIEPFVRLDPHDPNGNDTNTGAEGINNPRFQAWLATIRKRGLHPSECAYATAHQMGTCRMGADPRSSVVDPHGQVWGVDGLYVADASVFPSASGVNPMVTNMAISDWISRGVAGSLGK